jgi:hypothetical protein
LDAERQNETSAVKEVLSYFVRNPQAADDLVGIARWRLMAEIARRKVDETSRALRTLVETGYLRETIVTGAPPIFSLNPEKLEEAKAFLDADETSGAKKE